MVMINSRPKDIADCLARLLLRWCILFFFRGTGGERTSYSHLANLLWMICIYIESPSLPLGGCLLPLLFCLC